MKIELRRSGDYLVIDSKFDQELINDIKSLHYKEREWTGSCWKVLEDSPNQSPEEETNLEFVRRIVAECCSRREWKLYDYTQLAAEEVNQQKAKDDHECHEAHVSAVTEILPLFPRRSLKLIRWEDKILKLQLNAFLSDEQGGYDLFMKLFKACTSVWKPRALASFDHKMSAGFVFEMASDERIIRKLIEVQTLNLKAYSLTPTQTFEDGTAHLVDSSGNHWVGCDYHKVDMSELNYDVNDWQVAATSDRLYWVAETVSYLQGWLEESPRGWLYFGGAFAIAHNRSSNIPRIIQWLHLEEWFGVWTLSLLDSQSIMWIKRPWNRYCDRGKAANWEHPSDQLFSHLNQFPEVYPLVLELTGLTAAELEAKRSIIHAKKAESSALATAEDKANAFELAKEQVICRISGKPELVKFAEKHGVQVRKSWTRDKIIGAFSAYPEVCQKLIGLKP